jgi:putative ABC transport system permease protein
MKGRSGVTGLDPQTVEGSIKLSWDKGSPATLQNLEDGQVILDKKYAKKHKYDVGDTIALETPTAAKLKLKVVGTVDDKADFLGDLVLPLDQVERDFDERQDSLALVELKKGAPVAPVKKEIQTLLDRRFPTVDSLNQAELKQRQDKQFDQLVALIYAFLSLAVVVSVFGIVNTLVLTIHERTRELGLLRAVGMSRRQVRRLVRYESVVTALIGAILGAVLGVFFAVVVSRPMADEGFVLKLPVGSIVAFLIFAAIAGVLAAIPPARRASRLDVLEALAYE